MKQVYLALYTLSAFLFVFAIAGGTVTKPVFNTVSENMLEKAGIKESYISATDDKIDEMFYSMKKIELQIAKLKNFFSTDKIDESKYQKEKNELIKKNLYTPVVEVINLILRVMLFLSSLILCLGAVIFHLVYRNMDLRRRVLNLEARMGV